MELFKTTDPARSISDVHFFSASWQPDIPVHKVQAPAGVKQVLIFYLDQQRNVVLRNVLEGHVVQSFRITGSGTISQFLATVLSEIDTSQEAHFNELFATVCERGRMPDIIIFDWYDTREFPEDISVQAERVFEAILHCCKSIMQSKQRGIKQLLFLYPEGDNGWVHPLFTAVGGLARAVQNEYPSLLIRSVGIDAASDVSVVINAEIKTQEAGESRYRNNQRYIKQFNAIQPESTGSRIALKEQGVYLITGGSGNLGGKIAAFLYERVKARLVITGRSKLLPGKLEQIERLQQAGAEIIYIQADLAKQEEVKRVVTVARKRFAALNGIIHCAGAAQDAFMINKTWEQSVKVIAPKVMGTVWLDEFTRNEPLDFFLSFSSVASVLGSVGQTDYAFANSFLDSFAEWRNACMAAGMRKGDSITVNWPFWQDGGMQAQQEIINYLSEIGISPISVPEGLAIFEQCLQLPAGQVLPLKGRKEQLPSFFFKEHSNNHTLKTPPMKDIIINREENISRQKIEDLLRQMIAEETRLPVSRIRPQETFDIYGIDSMMTLSLVRKLEKRFGNLPKTLFFEYNTLHTLTQYFLENYAAHLPDAVNGQQETAAVIGNGAPTVNGKFDLRKKRTAVAGQNNLREKEVLTNDIAIVGLAGKYPMADNIHEFWDNLEKGRDCIVEIPEDRWDYHDYFAPEKGKPGRMYSKWGGFVSDVDKFDPLFFNIAPAEAEVMDPQARLFLQTAWHAVEDAGYTRKKLKAFRTGVFVGVMYSDYQLYSAAEGNALAYTSSFSYIANRVSFFMDLSGPSIAVDTMCSSSLTAIHLACRSIQSGECDMAIAGGVNLTVHPHKYLVLSQGRFAASDGRCRSFGEGGDGYVPGEGVGALLLKPLDKAKQDGDYVYGVIKGSALNHGGRTNGFTVPSPRAQGEVIAGALKRAGIDPATISYIEAHGTGTSLGDPVEVAGLTKAFEKQAKDREGKNHFQCAIGSVKSNIGHLESAAGIAAVTKVLLQFKHKQLVPSIHAGKLNSNIDFEGTPFKVQREAAPWVISPHPLRAGVSGFGAGGANAHLILEEYAREQFPGQLPEPDHYIILLSAKNKDRLLEYAVNLLKLFVKDHPAVKKDPANDELHKQLLQDLRQAVAFITNAEAQSLSDNRDLTEYGMSEKGKNGLIAMIAGKHNISYRQEQFPDHTTIDKIAHYLEKAMLHGADKPADITGGEKISLYDMAYTLQTGREEMEERLAFVVTCREELVERLTAFCNGTAQTAHTYYGNVNDESEGSGAWLLQGDAGKQLLEGLVEGKENDGIARLWVKGVEVNWENLYEAHGSGVRKPARIPLPVYPFAREVFWPAIPARPTSAPATASGVLYQPACDAEVKGWDKMKLRSQLEKDLKNIAASLVKANPDSMSVTVGLNDFGFGSMQLVDLANDLNKKLDLDITPAVFYERNSIRSFADFLLQEHNEKVIAFYENVMPVMAMEAKQQAPAAKAIEMPPESVVTAQDDIAIIGMSGTFPQSKDLREFWENLMAGRDMISEVPGDRWNWNDYAEEDDKGNKRYKARWGGFISDVDKFDARFFNISPLEAEMMDPQQRLLLENVWKTIEDAGYKATDLSGKKIGLFIGSQFHDYQLLLSNNVELNAQAGLGNEHAILVNRISYLLNLKGPSEPYNTACSSALVAVHRAISSIKMGESAMAIAGGISLILSPLTTLAGETLGMLSPDGKCKTLDASANGYVRGEGVGTVLLKPLKKAEEDHDHIYAVIRSTAVNHGGKAASLTAPNSESQASLLVEAYEKARISPQTISYLELHGTGTKLGDPVEIEGIKSAFRRLSKEPLPQQYCGLGSVKTNIGHLEPAAGIAGLIKLTLSLQYKMLPGILHLNDLNPYVRITDTPFYIVDKTRKWEPLKSEEGYLLPRRAGVSSFGFGGVNAHVVLEEYLPAPPVKPSVRQPRLFVFSAKNKERLNVYVRSMLEFLQQDLHEGEDAMLERMAYTLQTGREEMEERLAVIAPDRATLKEKLQDYLDGKKTGDNIFSGTPISYEPEEKAALRERGDDILAVNNLQDLARHWVSGGPVSWGDMYRKEAPYRMSLPAYPFEKKRYWAPVNGHVKPAKKANRDKDTEETSSHAPATGEADLLAREIKALFMKELKSDEDLDPDMNFEIFGIESILSSVITQRLRERFGDFISFTTLMEYPTLRKLIAFVREGLGIVAEDGPEYNGPAVLAATDKRISKLPEEVLPLNLGGNKTPSFWVHGGPGYAAFYRKLSESLGKDYPFFAFQARGVDGKKIPHSFEEMINHYKSCILLAKPEGPYVIGGYSFGGLVAYEIARRMHLEGHRIAHLVIFDTLPSTKEALDRFYPYYGGNDNLVTIMMGNEFAGARDAGRAFVSLNDLEGVPEPLRVGHIAKLAKERGRNIPLTPDEMYGYINACIKIAGQLTELTYGSYRGEAYHGSDVLYFKARCFLAASNVVFPIEEDHDPFVGYDYVGEWAKICKKGFNVVDVPSDHLHLIEEPGLQVTAREIKRVIDAVSGK